MSEVKNTNTLKQELERYLKDKDSVNLTTEAKNIVKYCLADLPANEPKDNFSFVSPRYRERFESETNLEKGNNWNPVVKKFAEDFNNFSDQFLLECSKEKSNSPLTCKFLPVDTASLLPELTVEKVEADWKVRYMNWFLSLFKKETYYYIYVVFFLTLFFPLAIFVLTVGFSLVFYSIYPQDGFESIKTTSLVLSLIFLYLTYLSFNAVVIFKRTIWNSFCPDPNSSVLDPSFYFRTRTLEPQILKVRITSMCVLCSQLGSKQISRHVKDKGDKILLSCPECKDCQIVKKIDICHKATAKL